MWWILDHYQVDILTDSRPRCRPLHRWTPLIRHKIPIHYKKRCTAMLNALTITSIWSKMLCSAMTHNMQPITPLAILNWSHILQLMTPWELTMLKHMQHRNMTNHTCAKIKKNHDTWSPLAKFCNEKSWNKKLSYRNLSTLAPSLNGNLAVISTLYSQTNQ